MTAPAPPLSREFVAALDWWRAAGVDIDFVDDVTDWLAKPEVEAAPEGSSEAKRPQKSDGTSPKTDAGDLQKTLGPKGDLLDEDAPSDLAAFQEWWLNAPGLDPIGPRGRVPPRGEMGAKLMVLVLAPEDGDKEQLLSGPQGRLLANMLAAMGFAAQEVYYASALTRPTPMADTAAIAHEGMAEVLALHIKLAAPEQVLALGSNIPPLLGHAAAQDAPRSEKNNHTSASDNNPSEPLTKLLVSESLESLMASPRLKARFWRRWIEWSANR